MPSDPRTRPARRLRPLPLAVSAGLLLAVACHPAPEVAGEHTLSVPPPPVSWAGPEAVEPASRDRYAHLEENPFRDPGLHPLSTFGIDVDAASYANVRRFLEEGLLPPAGAVRVEELVNAFAYDLPDPAGDAPLAVTSEVGPAPWNPAHRLVRIGLQGRRMDADALPPANLVFLVDVSGSMAGEDRLPLLRRALALLVGELRPEDHVAIVAYAGAAGLVLPPTSGRDRGTILDALDRLAAGGSTAGGEGIRLAYRVARENFKPDGNNRVLLATDGDFNVGVSSADELVRLIEEERQGGVALTVLGMGRGNLNDASLEALANRGNGNYAYLDGIDEARRVLVEERAATLLTIAKDVKVQVEMNPALVRSYRLIGYENRALAPEDFADDARDAGELGAGHSVTALYEIVPVDAPTPGARTAGPLRYQTPRGLADAAVSGELMTVRLRWQAPAGGDPRETATAVRDDGRALDATSDDFRFAAAVAAWGMLLRDSPHRGAATHAAVARWAADARGADADGRRAAFLRLVHRGAALADARPPAGETPDAPHDHGG